jgi:hypothetical protein
LRELGNDRGTGACSMLPAGWDFGTEAMATPRWDDKA